MNECSSISSSHSFDLSHSIESITWLLYVYNTVSFPLKCIWPFCDGNSILHVIYSLFDPTLIDSMEKEKESTAAHKYSSFDANLSVDCIILGLFDLKRLDGASTTLVPLSHLKQPLAPILFHLTATFLVLQKVDRTLNCWNFLSSVARLYSHSIWRNCFLSVCSMYTHGVTCWEKIAELILYK